MKRPITQWFTRRYEARRIDFSQAESLSHTLSEFEVDQHLIERVLSGLHNGDRVELFSLHTEIKDADKNADKDANKDADKDADKERWALFTPTLQVIPRSLIHTSSIDDLFIAAQSWLIARGYQAVYLLDERGLPLSLNSWSGISSSPIDALNHALAERAPLKSMKEGGRHSTIDRLVSLAPSNLEILIALNAAPRVIACEDSSDVPVSLSTLERLGPDLNPNIERVAALAPQLTLSSLSVPGMERIVTRLASLGVPQLTLAPRSLNDVMGDIERVASLLRLESRGVEVIRSLKDQRQELLNQRPPQLTPVYLEWWPKPMFTPGRACFSNELIELAGGLNVFGEREGSSVEITPAELVEAEPQLCFISWCGVALEKLNPDNLKLRSGLEKLNASAMKQVIPIDESYTGRPGPNMLEASRQMAAAIQRWREAT